jgi:hypothetical protein
MTPHQRARIENLLKQGVTVRIPRGQDIGIGLTALEVDRGIVPPPAPPPPPPPCRLSGR